ncbi:hypothetical protein [Noviherbaspirillum soli]|nr:hypothetical protein [Noviherbaspirillum soli]
MDIWLASKAPLQHGPGRPVTSADKSKQEHNGRSGGTHERIDKESHT